MPACQCVGGSRSDLKGSRRNKKGARLAFKQALAPSLDVFAPGKPLFCFRCVVLPVDLVDLEAQHGLFA